jgi:Arc/MetJ-type ribon-helix-helix transcriptional regulator
MASITVGFSITEQDKARLEYLVKRFGDGNRSAFLRAAMKRMEVLDRAERLRELQDLGGALAENRGINCDSVEDIVHRVLAKSE